MIEVCFLGTGGSVATRERDNTSFLINRNGALILVDCPGGVIQKIKKLNFDPRQVSIILVTHIHPDHVYGLPSFVHSLMLDECRIQLIGSRQTTKFCRDYLDLFELRDKKIKTRVEFVSLKAGNNYQFKGSLKCSPLKVPHSPSSLAYHFYFEDEGKELIYSGDTPPSPLLFKQAEGIDCLIHDSSAPSRFFEEFPSLRTMHTSSLELGELSERSRVKCLIPCHFFGEVEFSLSEIEEEIRKNYKGKLIIPKDFERIAL